MTDIIIDFKKRNPDPAVQVAAFALVADVLQDRRLTEAKDLDSVRAQLDYAAMDFAGAASDAGRKL
jgi:hypothetical protein